MKDKIMNLVDKFKPLLKKIFNKFIKPLFNKKWKVCVWVGLILLYVISNVVVRKIAEEYVLRAVDYLEDEGYECDFTEEYGNDFYRCEYVQDGEMKHIFDIKYCDDCSAFKILKRDNYSFYVNYELKHKDDHVTFIYEETFRKNVGSLYGYSDVIENYSKCSWVASDWQEEYDNYIDKDANVTTLYQECYASKDGCGLCMVYEDRINYALDIYREIYDEVDLELFVD